MAKSLLLLAVFVSVGICLVKSETCTDGLGACALKDEGDCDSKCKVQHGPTSQGSCDATLKPPLCNCYYSCLPPQPKFCAAGLGICSTGCLDECCSQNCASAYPGGSGMCSEIGTVNLCQCQYPCHN